MYRSRVAGTGSYLPEKVLLNSDLEKLVDTNDQWIRERTGIERRHIAADHQITSDLALIACQKALQAAGIAAEQVELLIVATVTGDQVMPSTACVLQNKLGLKNIPAFDLSAACSGFIYSLSVADQFIKTGQYKTILIVGAEIIHRFVNYEDRETCILFGDGAGAFVLTRAEENDANYVMSTHMRAEGALGELFVLPAGGSKIPFSQDVLENKTQFVKMKGREIFKNAVRTMSSTCHEALEKNQIAPEKVDWLVPHQANMRIMEAVADHFGFPKEKVISVVHEMGNTSAATIPVAFDMAVQDGRIQRGQTILLTAFGAGLTAGSALLRY
ncbi:MAG: ketoacyl-ACP synthase III [Proteobacteria bacterium]|jgi:3-oxoacyl-[acyl-carrier-protein] synthase-3|nr:ketoacyl-ACP synthase III [Pseudomonadota bacterium]